MPNDAPLVRVFNADLGGCGHYRLIWPAQAAAAAGGNVHIGGPLHDVRERRVEGGRIVDERIAVETDAELARVAEYANPTPSTEERIATLEADLAVAKEQAAKADALQAVLVDKGVIAEADVVAIAAPAEQVAIKG